MKNQSTNHADIVATFEGFMLPAETLLPSDQEFSLPQEWKIVSKQINNLAEFKVVEYVLWQTWGEGKADGLVAMMIEDFMYATGLSKQSVITGITKAIEHGYIERQIQYYLEDGRVCSVRHYGLKLYQTQVNDLDFDPYTEGASQDVGFTEIAKVNDLDFRDEMALQADCAQSQDIRLSSNELELSTHNYYYEDVSRIQEDQFVDDDQPAESSPRKTKMGKYPAFICARIEQFSQTLGDHEHTTSNIGQAHHIYLDYIAKGGNAKAFVELMDQAKEITQKKSAIRRKNKRNERNSMPYFFAVLRRACKESKGKVAA